MDSAAPPSTAGAWASLHNQSKFLSAPPQGVSSLRASTLSAQIAALQAQADALRKKEVAEVVAKIKDANVHYGLTAAELGLATGARENAKLSAAGSDKPASKRCKKVGAKSVARTVKFKAALASGKTPEELLATI